MPNDSGDTSLVPLVGDSNKNRRDKLRKRYALHPKILEHHNKKTNQCTRNQLRENLHTDIMWFTPIRGLHPRPPNTFSSYLLFEQKLQSNPWEFVSRSEHTQSTLAFSSLEFSIHSELDRYAWAQFRSATNPVRSSCEPGPIVYVYSHFSCCLERGQSTPQHEAQCSKSLRPF